MHRLIVPSVSALLAAVWLSGQPSATTAQQMNTTNATKSFAAIDTDKDDKLDRAELTAAAGADFDRLDVDHDKYLTLAELKTAQARDARLLLLPLPGRMETAATFTAADTDNDKKIDKHEYEAAIVKAYLSCDANRDGTIEMSDLKHCSR